MGAVDTMEDFFEKLNEGDRSGAVALMDERVEMRIHVGDNARTLRGVEQVGGWFLRAEPGLKMIPGEVRDLGITYQADVLSVRPGAPSQHLDASFRVEAGKITSINLRPALTGTAGAPIERGRPASGLAGDFVRLGDGDDQDVADIQLVRIRDRFGVRGDQLVERNVKPAGDGR